MSNIIGKIAGKSCGIDPIPATLLKRVLPSVMGPINSIVNNSITTGIFTQSWKTAIICPLLKKSGLLLQLSNLRPVSNLSFMSHVVECAILQMFKKHCKDQDLIPDYQSAYCANYSCETALVKLSMTSSRLWRVKGWLILQLLTLVQSLILSITVIPSPTVL